MSFTNPTHDQMVQHLRHTIKVASRAKSFGRHPFGSILVGPDHETVLLEQGNIDTLHHAESTLCHVACKSSCFHCSFFIYCSFSLTKLLSFKGPISHPTIWHIAHSTQILNPV